MKVRAKVDVNALQPDGSTNYGLTPGRFYCVVEICDTHYRVIDDLLEPILYRKAAFEVLDNTIPAGWQLDEYADGQYYICPKALAHRGFFEDLFDRKPEAVALYRAWCQDNGLPY